MPYREAQSCLTPAFAASTYQFFLSGTNTPANVYEDGALTTPFPITGFVTSDNFGRFPPIYLDTSIIYRVQFYDSTNTLRWQVDPYTPPLATVGTSSKVAFGMNVASTGEITIPAPNSGGTGISLTLKAGALGSAPLQVSNQLPGNSAIIINSSATTGAQTATFAATNKPGTATSSPAGWLPITCDGVQYYTPIWHGNNFTPYAPNPTALGEVIVAQDVFFGGNGVTAATNGTAVPGNWFTPPLNNVGASYYINITKTGGLSGLGFVQDAITIATAAPSGGTYTGGTLTANYSGNTASNYTLQLSTGQMITGCTFTNGSTTFTCPSTSITGSPNTQLTVRMDGVWFNITSGGTTIENNGGARVTGTYQISSSATGSPVVAAGTIALAANPGVQSNIYNGVTPLVLGGNGTATLNGASAANWYSPTGAIGNNFYILITQTGGTSGYSFSAGTGTGSYTNITNSGLSIGINGPTGQSFSVTGTYIIASDPAGANQLGSGTIMLTGGTDVQSNNYSGTTPLALLGNGAATLNSISAASWYSPNVANIGSGYWIDITRTGGTSGVNFSTAQGSWTNIGTGGITIGITGTTGDVGTVSASGSYQISNNSSGTPVLGSGTISLSVSGLTVLHIYTTAVTNSTETIPTGTTTVQCEIWGSGGGGGGGHSASGGGDHTGGTGGDGGFSYSSYAASTLGGAGNTFKYTITTGGAGGAFGSGNGSSGSAGSITAGTVTSFTTMTANGGTGGVVASSANNGANGSGGTASGGNNTNTAGGTSGAGVTGKISGDGSPYGAGALGGNSTSGATGSTGAAVFFYS